MENYHFDERDDVNVEALLSIESQEEDDALAQLRSVRSPADIARLGGALHEQYEYESLDEVSTQSNQIAFLSLFPNRFASCIKRGKDGGWRQTSQFHHLSDEEIIESISSQSTTMRAIMPDKLTRFAAIVLDNESYYKTTEGLEKLRDCLRCLGVNHVKLYQFEETAEWQLVAFFQDAVNSEKVGNLLAAWLRRNGIVPGTGGVTVFPGSEPFCLPLQPGFSWINDTGHVIVCRNEVSPEAALALFVADVERSANNGEELVSRLEQILAGSDK